MPTPEANPPKPLVLAIRVLLASGLAIGAGLSNARAELPVPVNGGTVGTTPVDIATVGLATAAVNANRLTIDQKSDKVVVDWKSFNIGEKNSVDFKQPSSSAVALNRIHDLNPSQILGTLQANGQVYLVNQNGFVFGKNSQVNVNSLVATTLGISEDVFNKGITKVFDLSNSAALEGNGPLYLKNGSGQFVLDAQGQKVKIQIFLEAGAKIKTQGDGGRVIIAAPTITNAGTIETPDGQTILAASQDKVYLQEAGSDSDIRGLLVEVGTGGATTNIGKVIAERGNVSLMGFAVNQKGIASATTSVRLNGSVRLLAREGIQNPVATGGKLLSASTVRAADNGDGLGKSATVTLSKGSITRVSLDTDKTATAIDAQTQNRSHIEMSGHRIVLQDQSLVEAKSGDVKIAAVDNPADPRIKGTARVQLEKGSKIDVSGVKNVKLSVQRNLVEVELRKNELKDSPLQREGILFGKKVWVDLRNAQLKYDPITGDLVSASVPIADIKGAVDRIARNIDERSTVGGSIELASSGSVVTKAGSLMDFSGGSIAYQEGDIKTTHLVADGQVFDIADADPNRTYTAILANTYARHEQGYVEGKAGGSLKISSYEAQLNGGLNGKTSAGLWQRTPEQQAAGSSFTIDLSNNNLFGKQDIVIGQAATETDLAIDQPIPRTAENNNQPQALVVDAGLFKRSGVQNVEIKTNGSLLIEQNAKLDLVENAQLTLSAVGVDILGSIIAPSGTVTVKPTLLPASGLIPSHLTLGSQALIDVSGLWVNDWLSTRLGEKLSTVAIKGGNVNLTAEQADLRIDLGSQIAASGGAWYHADGTITGGDGGTIALTAASHEAGGKLASLVLDGKLSAYGLYQGGSLQLSTNEVLIGSGSIDPLDGSGAVPLVLVSDFFNQGGFADYRINANYDGLTVADNTQLNVFQRNRLLHENAYTQASGTKFERFSTIVKLPDTLRKATDLSLSLTQVAGQRRDPALTIGTNARINTDIQAHLDLSSDSSIFMNGILSAPAGTISLTIDTPTKGDGGFFANQGLWLGQDSQILATGAYKESLNPYRLRTGEVLSGGSILLTANRGYIVSAANSVLDVSGTASTLDFIETSANGGKSSVVSRLIRSEGGTISLKAAEGMLLDGGFKAQGGSGAAGGTLAIELNGGLRNKPEVSIAGGAFPDDADVKKPRAIEVRADTAAIIPEDLAQGTDINTALYNGRVLLNAAQLNTADADVLSLKLDATAGNDYTGSLVFDGDVQLNAQRQITLDAPVYKTALGQVTLNTNYALLGSSQSRLDTQLGGGLFTSRLAPTAVTGDGQLTVNANGIDLLGGLSFNGFGTVNLNSLGDVRTIGIRGLRDTRDYLGELNLAGDLNIKASQIYPTTLSHYTFNLTGNSNNTVAFQNSGNSPGAVYSAGGTLTVNAPNITQQGMLKAPFGVLNLNASNTLTLSSGSLTSVSGNGLTVPFGQVSGGSTWLYPFDSTGALNLLIDTPPEKRLQLSGRDIALSPGATVDLSGGGDLYAYEFIPGPGGSQNVLAANTSGFSQKFAVLPTLGNSLTPYDPQVFSASGLQVGDSVYLGAGSGLAPGWYTLLPAQYALLPGAYLITPQTGTQDYGAGQSTQDFTGATIVAGRYGNPSAQTQNDRWQGFAVEAGAVARTRSEFKDYLANSFFAEKATQEATAPPQLPNDAGSLSIAVTNSLNLGASLLAKPVLDGLGGQVDISANRLAIVGNQDEVASSPVGTVSLWDDDLNALNAPSLLLGGVRSKDKKGQRVTVATQSLTLAGDSQLQGQEILLAARDQLTVSSGAVLESTGKSTAVGADVLLENSNHTNSDGALLRVSNLGQGAIIRDKTVTAQTGVLVVESGARLAAQGSMALDSTQNTVFDGAIDMTGGALSLKSSRISLGDAPANTPGLVLKDTAFSLDELTLISTSDFDIYGNVGINTKQLAIDAAHINGYNQASDAVTIAAEVITLSNSGASSQRTGNGTGSLTLAAGKRLELGGGDVAISGFNQTQINATDSIKGLGQTIDPVSGVASDTAAGLLHVNGDLSVNAGQFIGGNGATTTLAATGAVTLQSAKTDNSIGLGGLGARWSISGSSITSTAWFDLPSGQLDLLATLGNIDLNAGTTVNVAGKVTAFDTVNQASAAGRVVLASQTGNVNLATGATLNLAGATLADKTVGDAGSLTVNANKGVFNWAGTVNAGGNAATGAVRAASLTMDVNRLESGFSAFNSLAQTAGFREAVNLRLRSGDALIAASDKVVAHRFGLSTDQGSITVNGSIDASAANGGSISLNARNGINLGADAQLDAHASADKATGGSVALNTVHQDDAASGLLNLAAGGMINVSGGKDGAGGSVHLRTGRGADNQFNLSAINTRIVGADPQRTNLEATRVYLGNSQISKSDIAIWKSDTDSFMDNAPSLSNNSGAVVNLLPGLEIRGQNDLTLVDAWDFIDWRYNGLPGYLTLTAGNNLNINASITDAFATDSLPGQSSRLYQDMLQPGLSWSYHLQAGADVNLAANYLAKNPLNPSSSSLVKTQLVVRTGTGSIAIDAGKNLQFVKDSTNASASAAVYTIGTTGKYTRNQLLQGLVPGVPAKEASETDAQYLNRMDPVLMDELLRFGYLDETRIGSLFQKAEFPKQGGNISLTAGGNIDGINTGQKISDWLVRSGALTDNNRPTLWGINISGDRSSQTGSIPTAKGIRTFNQNVGALGGGNVSVSAGGNINNLSVMMPTTGKPLGTVSDTANQWLANAPAINGGGSMQVSAGNDIVGGEYFSGLGTASIHSGGSIKQGTNGLGSVFALGDSQVSVQARKDLNIGAAYNPTLLKQAQVVGGDTRFFTYTADSAIGFSAAAGNIVFQNAVDPSFEYAVYPGTVKATAFSGDISLNNSMTLYPAQNGQLQLLADNSIRSTALAGQTVNINVSDTDVSLLPNASNPAASLEGSINDGLIRARERLDPSTPTANIIHAAIPVHQGSSLKSQVISNQGDIVFNPGSQVTFHIPTAADFIAGRDIRNISVIGQNLLADDITRIQAGRDINFDTQINTDGVVLANDNQIQLGGAGQLYVLAGRDINLGAAVGIQTIGNIYNPVLAATGASVSMAAGLSDKVDYAGFINKYADSYPKLLQGLAELSDDEQQQKLSVFLQVLFAEIKQSATAAARVPEAQRSRYYQQGFDAINALFPGDKYSGDLSFVFSQIKTLDGGDINVAAPGGKIDVGLAGQLGGIRKAADELGMVVQQQGALNAVSAGDFNVNQSRVFTLGGGDITVWSSKGSIDAGKGAKSAIAAPPPITSVDEKGNIVTTFPPIVSGSGIQAIGNGQVTLAAPKGIVDAGEAGISGGQIVIAATAVVGASNIQASGGTVGVPSAPPAPVVPSGANSAATSAAKSASDQANDDSRGNTDDDETNNKAKSGASTITTDVVSYGDCSAADVRNNKAGCGDKGEAK
ncbi:MAG: filamentous hemagglutinin N-terminal domain-containing protein [Methylococcaceae bacterium]|nr:filamentous hemagglutinin N-terminal domain-containing protein [Methylococcaceae bacterium]